MTLTLAYIGHVWPEPESSAAGIRAIGLIEAFKSAGYDLHFLSPPKPGSMAPGSLLGVKVHPAAPNDPAFDRLIDAICPDVVLFDRFHVEERFGWRVSNACPQALRVLDTVDLHGLRSARQEHGRGEVEPEELGAEAVREIASILRSDLALVISPGEAEMLTAWGVRPEQVFLSRILHPAPAPLPAQGHREGFAWIGNFRHPPNLDSVFWLKTEIWPLIRARLPAAEIAIYGAYPPRVVMAFDDSATGFRVKGPARDSQAALSRHLINLAPLRFGAGIKGKIVEGWRAGLPAVTTSVGAEGLLSPRGQALPGNAYDDEWGGIVADGPEGIAQAAARLYADETLRSKLAERGAALARELFDHDRESRILIAKIETLRASLKSARGRNLLGRVLWQQSHRSTEYFSRWIEAKSALESEKSRQRNP